MDLTMEGRKVLPQPGQSLLELVKQLGLDGSTLTERPLAAKIAGEVFTLNYIPVRQKEAEADRQSMRRAMAASNGEIRLLRYADPAGKECYIPHGAVHDFPCHAAAVAGGNGKNDLHAGFQRVHQRCGGKGFFRFDPESAGQ